MYTDLPELATLNVFLIQSNLADTSRKFQDYLMPPQRYSKGERCKTVWHERNSSRGFVTIYKSSNQYYYYVVRSDQKRKNIESSDNITGLLQWCTSCYIFHLPVIFEELY